VAGRRLLGRGLMALLVPLLTMAAGAPISPPDEAWAAAPTPKPPPPCSLQLAPARHVQVQGLSAASPTDSHPNTEIPLLTNDQAAYASWPRTAV
jgi:hypothetical protein